LVLILIPAGVVTESHGVGAVMAQRMRYTTPDLQEKPVREYSTFLPSPPFPPEGEKTSRNTTGAGPETPGFTCKVPEIAVEIKLKSKKSLFPQRFRRSLRRRGNLPSRRREIRLVAAVSR